MTAPATATPPPPPPSYQPHTGYQPPANPLMGLPAPAPLPMPRPVSVPEYQPPPRMMEQTALVRPPQNRTGLWIALVASPASPRWAPPSSC